MKERRAQSVLDCGVQLRFSPSLEPSLSASLKASISQTAPSQAQQRSPEIDNSINVKATRLLLLLLPCQSLLVFKWHVQSMQDKAAQSSQHKGAAL